MPGILPTEYPPEPHGSEWRVLKFHTAIQELQFAIENYAEQLGTIGDAIFFKFWIGHGEPNAEGHWSNPTLADDLTKVAAALVMLNGNGKIQVLEVGMQPNEPDAWIEYKISLYYRFVFFSDLLTLDQSKKRQWGLFVKTRNRKPRHRGPKSDLLYLRAPHK